MTKEFYIHIYITVFCLLIFCSISINARSQTSNKVEPPKILMIEIFGITPDSLELFKAIRAQLSASPFPIERIVLNSSQGSKIDNINTVSIMASDYNAKVLFWIKNETDTCTVSFYIYNDKGGKIIKRVLNINSDIQSTRFEIISNAVSTLFEESIDYIMRMPPPPPNKVEHQPEPVDEKPLLKRKYAELAVNYYGSLFAPGIISHGINGGVGLFPHNNVAINASYTENLMINRDNTDYRFHLKSRIIDLSIASRFIFSHFEFRAGASWSVDLRFFSLSSSTDSITPRTSSLEAVHSVTPFIILAFKPADRFAISLKTGADIAINERVYKINRDDGTLIDVAKPYPVKFIFSMGFIIFL